MKFNLWRRIFLWKKITNKKRWYIKYSKKRIRIWYKWKYNRKRIWWIWLIVFEGIFLDGKIWNGIGRKYYYNIKENSNDIQKELIFECEYLYGLIKKGKIYHKGKLEFWRRMLFLSKMEWKMKWWRWKCNIWIEKWNFKSQRI